MGFPESPSVSSSLHAAAPRSVTHNNDHNHLFIIRFIVLRFFEGYLVTSVVSALGRVIDSVLTLPKRSVTDISSVEDAEEADEILGLTPAGLLAGQEDED